MMAAAATSSNYQREQTNERHLRHNLSLLLPATYPTLPYFYPIFQIYCIISDSSSIEGSSTHLKRFGEVKMT